MANTKSAEKAARQAEKHRAHNVTLRSRMRTAIRKVSDAVAKGDKTRPRPATGRRAPDRHAGQQAHHSSQPGQPAQEPPGRARQGRSAGIERPLTVVIAARAAREQTAQQTADDRAAHLARDHGADIRPIAP